MNRTPIHRFAMAFAVVLPALFVSAGAVSASSNTADGDVAALRLDAEKPDRDGTVRGSLTIRLRPGWKTYWLDPGGSGIPPQIDFGATDGLGSATVRTPLPHRFGDDLTRANGYKEGVVFPFVLEAAKGRRIEGPITAKVFVGACKDICVPVQATLSTDPSGGESTAPPSDSPDRGVEDAFEALPKAIDPAAVEAKIDGDTLVLALTGPADPADAFVLGPSGWYFGEPATPTRAGETTTFRVPIDERPADEAHPSLTVLFDDGGQGLETALEPR